MTTYDRHVYGCACRATETLCSDCVRDDFATLRGTAACRGELWSEDVARRVRTNVPWPSGPKVQAIARRKVADLTRDERLLELLAAELVRWAARRWRIERQRLYCGVSGS